MLEGRSSTGYIQAIHGRFEKRFMKTVPLSFEKKLASSPWSLEGTWELPTHWGSRDDSSYPWVASSMKIIKQELPASLVFVLISMS